VSLLPVEPAWRLAERKEEHRWLVAGLWGEQAVGIVGGEPKCCKSFLALDLAVAVAAGVPCLRRFAVPRAGRVLLYAAEDALDIVRRRLKGICAAAGLRLAELDVQVITAPSVRLDVDLDRSNLAETAARLPARAAATPRRRRACRPPRQEGRRTRPGRAGPARLIRVPRLGRLQPLPAPQWR
jgi:hypothetical protein